MTRELNELGPKCLGLSDQRTLELSDPHTIGPRAGPRDVAAGGGALKAEVLNRAAKAARGESMRWGLIPPLIRGVIRGASPDF